MRFGVAWSHLSCPPPPRLGCKPLPIEGPDAHPPAMQALWAPTLPGALAPLGTCHPIRAARACPPSAPWSLAPSPGPDLSAGPGGDPPPPGLDSKSQKAPRSPGWGRAPAPAHGSGGAGDFQILALKRAGRRRLGRDRPSPSRARPRGLVRSAGSGFEPETPGPQGAGTSRATAVCCEGGSAGGGRDSASPERPPQPRAAFPPPSPHSTRPHPGAAAALLPGGSARLLKTSGRGRILNPGAQMGWRCGEGH